MHATIVYAVRSSSAAWETSLANLSTRSVGWFVWLVSMFDGFSMASLNLRPSEWRDTGHLKRTHTE